MKKNKGFTLIELLTVIAILAIILLIAAPTILGVLDKARKNTFKNQALLYVSGLKTQMALSATGDSDIESKLNWTTEGNKRVTTISISELNNLIMDTEGLTSGSIKIEEDLTTNKYTYTFVDVANLDYKIPGSVLSTELDVEDIYKADEKVEDKEETNEPEEIVYSHTIGQEVTLKDGSIWYVIENSEETSDTVTLLADQNVKIENENMVGWTTEPNEYKIAFDEANARTPDNGNTYCDNSVWGCNIYAKQDGIVTNGTATGTVVEDSTIKKFIDSSVLTYINNSLTSNGGISINSIRLITEKEYNNIKSNDWSYKTNYWTMTPYLSAEHYVIIINASGDIGGANAKDGYDSTYTSDGKVGIRPVIVTPKSNIQ